MLESFFNPTSCFIYLAVALVVLVAEAFIPSFGVLTIVSAIFAIAAIVSAFFNAETYTFGFTVLGVVVVGFPSIIIFMFSNLEKFPAGKKLVPPPPEKSRDLDEEEYLKLVGKKGITLTPLMPTGIIRVNGKRIDVLTSGERIGKNSVVEITRVEGNRIYVIEKDS